MERLVINFNQQGFENSIRRMNRAAKLVDGLLQAYKKFQDATEMKDLDIDGLKSILRGRRGAVELMIDNYVLEQKKPLQKYYADACYTALPHLDPVFFELRILQEQANRDGLPSHLHDAGNWPINEKLEMVVDESFQEGLKPHFELVIESETDHGLWERLKALEVAHNEFFRYAKQMEVSVPNGFNALFGTSQTFPQVEVKAFPGNVLPSRSIHWRP